MNNSRDVPSFWGDESSWVWWSPSTSPGALKLTFVIWTYHGHHHLGFLEPEVTIFWRTRWVETFLPQPEINLALSSILHTTLYWRPSDWDYILIRKLLTEVISQETESFSNKLTFSHTPFETSGTTLPHVATSFSFLSDPGAQSIFFF